jgi:hypothetical protein
MSCGFCGWNAEDGVIIESVIDMGSMVFDCVTLSAKMLHNFIFEFETCVIASDMNFHRITFSKKKENRWHFCQRFLS